MFGSYHVLYVTSIFEFTWSPFSAENSLHFEVSEFSWARKVVSQVRPKNVHQKAVCMPFAVWKRMNLRQLAINFGTPKSHVWWDKSSAPSFILFPGPYADAWDEACDLLSFSEDCSFQRCSRICTVETSHPRCDTHIPWAESWTGLGLCVLHEGQDLQDILILTEAMTFPSCRGSAYVTAESGVLKFHGRVQCYNTVQVWFQTLTILPGHYVMGERRGKVPHVPKNSSFR